MSVEEQPPQDYAYDEDDNPEASCQTCGGDGVEECEDIDSSEGCWHPNTDGHSRIHVCSNCHGTGLAKDQWYW